MHFKLVNVSATFIKYYFRQTNTQLFFKNLEILFRGKILRCSFASC